MRATYHLLPGRHCAKPLLYFFFIFLRNYLKFFLLSTSSFPLLLLLVTTSPLSLLDKLLKGEGRPQISQWTQQMAHSSLHAPRYFPDSTFAPGIPRRPRNFIPPPSQDASCFELSSTLCSVLFILVSFTPNLLIL